MEFACGFVYVTPPVSQRDGQRSGANVIKRSALLPPVNRVRPSIPPPPPPTNSAEAKSPKFPRSPKIFEQLEKSKVKKVVKPSPFYENAEFHNKQGTASSTSTIAQQTTSPRRTALLPPHMRPAASSQSDPYSQPLNSSQTLTYDLPKSEPDLNAHPWDPNYSYSTPEGTGGEVKLPADSNNVLGQTPAPALPPRPSFMKSMPEYVVLLPSSRSPPSSSQKLPSTSSPSQSSAGKGSADKEPLPGNPNVVLVIICTDGKANTELGNLEAEDNDARTLLSSTIFYQELGEYAANQGVTVSVLSIEGTDCRLDELGRLADRTGGKVVIASPNRLHPEFEQIIENRTIATHCTVTLLLPKTLQMRGEREAGHKGTREVGNVDPDTEITFQFGANEHDTEVLMPASGSRVSIQLQIRYRQRNGQMMLRVITSDREVTDDSSAALSSLSLAIIQLNSSQASAALAVRGRFLDARREGELQRKLIERAIEHNHSAQDKQTYKEWVETMEPIYNNIHNLTRRKSVISDSQSLTDAGAVLLYTMKHSNRKSISLKNKHRL
ncbi:circularly permutated Ras protein 1-like protein [Lates japonicus]|uniref:Circularly permutated Ras protein 1-like protein n=1 Tax=Lates japonicus TaxID=270547 RepID=A0AAD3MM47_LATJO|nr:circularly permutated Ras protein 1-like protein [Lates japonicus]